MTHQWEFSQNDLLCGINNEVEHGVALTSGSFRRSLIITVHCY
jgi:hypothetical protein